MYIRSCINMTIFSFDIGLLRRKIQEELQSRFSMKRSQVGGQSGLKKPSQTNISPTSKLQKAINTKLLPGDIRYQIAKVSAVRCKYINY